MPVFPPSDRQEAKLEVPLCQGDAGELIYREDWLGKYRTKRIILETYDAWRRPSAPASHTARFSIHPPLTPASPTRREQQPWRSDG